MPRREGRIEWIHCQAVERQHSFRMEKSRAGATDELLHACRDQAGAGNRREQEPRGRGRAEKLRNDPARQAGPVNEERANEKNTQGIEVKAGFSETGDLLGQPSGKVCRTCSALSDQRIKGEESQEYKAGGRQDTTAPARPARGRRPP